MPRPRPALRLERLDGRDVPAAVQAAATADGLVWLAGGRGFRPFDDFAGRLSVAAADVTGDARPELIVGAGPGGGSRVGIFDAETGRRVRPDFLVFEPEFRGGVSVAAAPRELFFGAGEGGGPVVVRYDPMTATELSRLFVGDPSSRAGVSGLAAFVPAAAPPPDPTPVPPPAAPVPPPAAPPVVRPAPVAHLRAVNSPDDPADARTLARIDAELIRVTAADAARFGGKGYSVYAFAGPGITTLPQFTSLKGEQTPNPGDGGRTYDQVGAVFWKNGAYISPGSVAATLHEVGHGVEAALTNDEFNRWRIDTFSVVSWAEPYLAASWSEAFAESYRRFRTGAILDADPADAALIRAFMLDVLGPNRTDL